MAQPIHTKIINRLAKSVLGEHQIHRKGQSRTWLDDQYWYTTVIEFQPFKDRQGTCLNVGVNFHWFQKEYLSFDIGSRESEFVEYENEVQFETEVKSLTESALAKAIERRTQLNDLSSAQKTILNHSFTSDELWGNYHRAVICGLNQNTNKAKEYFETIIDHKGEIKWMMELKDRSNQLKTMLSDTSKFKNQIESIISTTRMEKKLAQQESRFAW